MSIRRYINNKNNRFVTLNNDHVTVNVNWEFPYKIYTVCDTVDEVSLLEWFRDFVGIHYYVNIENKISNF